MRAEILSVLIWFQAVNKDYQQMTKDASRQGRDNSNNDIKYMRVIKKYYAYPHNFSIAINKIHKSLTF